MPSTMPIEERERRFNPSDIGPHRFELRDGEWWCSTEEVISDECCDYDRCNNDCVCNDTEQGQERTDA